MGKKFVITAGELVHWNGIPFRLSADTVVEGDKSNYDKAYALLQEKPLLPDPQPYQSGV